MFTPSDIVVLVLIVGSGILIWAARRAGSNPRNNASSSPDRETRPSAEQIEVHCETNNRVDHGQTNEKDAPRNY